MKSWKAPKYSHHALLLCLMGTLLLSPALLQSLLGGFVLELFITAILLLSLYTLGTKLRLWLPALIMALPSLALSWSQLFGTKDPIIPLASALLNGICFLYVAAALAYNAFHQARISLDLVYGAMSGYLLLGLMWAMFYLVMETQYPGSFEGIVIDDAAQYSGELAKHHFEDFLYFSFVTLTTLGYGDLVPAIPQARALAITEALTGQFYLTVLLGRLIGMHLQQSSR